MAFYYLVEIRKSGQLAPVYPTIIMKNSTFSLDA